VNGAHRDVEARLAKLGVRPEDLDESFTRSGGPGGQNVNKVETAVLLVHRPSGVVVRCSEARSQEQNRRLARVRLAEKLEGLAREREARLRHELELERRRKRPRPHGLKLRILEHKRRRSSVKANRRRPSGDD